MASVLRVTHCFPPSNRLLPNSVLAGKSSHYKKLFFSTSVRHLINNNTNSYKQIPLSNKPPSIASTLNLSQLKNPQFLRCTIFKDQGEISNFNEAISKDELCHQHNLNPRDLRKLNTVAPPSVPVSAAPAATTTTTASTATAQASSILPNNHIISSSPVHVALQQDKNQHQQQQQQRQTSSILNYPGHNGSSVNSSSSPLISISSSTHGGGLQKNIFLEHTSSKDILHDAQLPNHTNISQAGTVPMITPPSVSSAPQLPPSLSSLVPSFIVRHDCILMNIIDLRCLIKSDTVIVFEQYDYKNMKVGYLYKQHSEFINELSERLRETSSLLPYEFRALEAIFHTVIKSLAQEFKYHNKNALKILSDLEYHIDRENLQTLLLNNKQIFSFYKKSMLCRDMIEDLLDDEQQLLEMYLTHPRKPLSETHQNSNNPLDGDHIDIEMLLETYRNHIDEIVSSSDSLLKSIKTTEEIINIILDSNRNELLLLGLRFSIGLLAFGGVMFIASAYGMNLLNFMEEDNMGFSVIVIVGAIIVGAIYVLAIKKLHHLEKITMHPTTPNKKSVP